MEFKCGRKTKTGTVCKNRSAWLGHGLIRTCTTHQTPEDAALAEIIELAYEKGVASERSRGKQEISSAIWEEKQALRRKFEEDQRVVDHRFRLRTDKGLQIVEVKGYAYIWEGSVDLEIGDTVTLPAAWGGQGWSGKVSALGTTYVGSMSKITSVMEKV